jgi:hypothetical protein
MAYSDLGVLLPTESQYGSPQAYSEEIRAEATQRANYLSQMDQYYTQLEESKRQFDLAYAAREKEFEWTSKFQETQLAEQTRIEAEKLAENQRQFNVAQAAANSQFEWSSGFQERKLSYEQQYSEKQLALETRKADLQAQLTQKQIEYQTAQLGFQKEQLGYEAQKLQAELEALKTNTQLAREEMALKKELGLGQLETQKYQVQTQADIALQELGLQKYSVSQQTKQNDFQNQLALLQTQLGMNQAYPYGIQTSQGGVGKYPSYTSATDYYKNQLSALSKAAKAGSTSTSTNASYNTYTPTASESNYYRLLG